VVHRLGGRTRTLIVIEMGGHFVMTRLAWPGSESVVDTFGPASDRLIVQTFRLPTLPLAGVTQKNRLAY